MENTPRTPGTSDAAAAIDERVFHATLTRAILWPIVIMLVLAGVFLGLIALLLNSASWVEHTDRVIADAREVQTLLVDRETGLRGYLLTGNPSFLDPYQSADARLPGAIGTLSDFVSDNPAQVERLVALDREREAWEAFAREALGRFESGGDYQSFVAAGIGKGHMDAVRGILDDFVATEEALRAERIAVTERVTLLVSGGSLALAALFGALLAWFTRRQLLALAGQYGGALAETARSAQRLRALHQIDQAILLRTPLPEIVAGALQRLAPLVGAPRVVALLRPPAQAAPLRLVVEPGGVQAQPVAWDPAHFAGLFAPRPAPQQLVVPAAQLGGDAPLVAGPLAEARVSDALVTPLRNNGDLCGVLALGIPTGSELSSDAVALLGEVADQLTIALQQEQLHHAVACHTAELERRVAERTAALEAANGELEAFAYSVAHDLRAPVRAMQSFAAALNEDYGDRLDALGQEYARRIANAGERMEELIDDLLAYSRLSRAELSFGPVSLRQALDDALAQLAETIAATGASVAVNEPLPVVLGHRTTLAQVLANLLANALTFVAPGTTPVVSVRAAASDGRARLEVADNGIGIAPEHQERIFRVFERLHGIERYPGTGIGLAIVRKGVERMGGRAGVRSEPGHGSVFWIELPTPEEAR